MREPKRTPAGEAMTPLILDLLRLNSLILTSGDRLVAALGLTSARWQVLGAVDAAERPQPVAWLARDIGGNRQNVQRIVNDLHRDGLLAFEPNPHHRRAHLVVMTEKGRKAFSAAMSLQTPWVNNLTEGFTVDEIGLVRGVVARLRDRLEQAPDSESNDD
jgi:DNA-binding MarR family transcriptional regulator